MRITNENYVGKAEQVIIKLKGMVNPRNGRPIQMVTTSKIRNLLAMTADIYNEVLNDANEKLSNDVVGRIEYLRVHFIYECGRDSSVKSFVTAAEILDILKEIGTNRENFVLFSRYMEALVAYHKYYDGKD